jgi:hypothetical protein
VGRGVRVAGPSAHHAVRPDLHPTAAGDPATAIRQAMREAQPAQPAAAHRTGSYALVSGVHQPKRKQKIIGDVRGFRPFGGRLFVTVRRCPAWRPGIQTACWRMAVAAAFLRPLVFEPPGPARRVRSRAPDRPGLCGQHRTIRRPRPASALHPGICFTQAQESSVWAECRGGRPVRAHKAAGT